MPYSQPLASLMGPWTSADNTGGWGPTFVLLSGRIGRFIITQPAHD